MCECEGQPDTVVKNVDDGRKSRLAVVCRECRTVIEHVDDRAGGP